jgi:autotransporter-associated beta strand protein
MAIWTGATNGNYADPQNWNPQDIPDGIGEQAVFTDAASITTVTVTSNSVISPDDIIFDADASAYTIIISPDTDLGVAVAGIVNDSGQIQNFIVDGGRLGITGTATIFSNVTTASNVTISLRSVGTLQFEGASSGGDARVIGEGGGGSLVMATTSGAVSIGSLEGFVSVGGTDFGTGQAATQSLTVGSLNTSTTFTGGIVDGTTVVALIKVGGGTLTFAPASALNDITYSGATTVAAGSLQAGAVGALSPNSAVTVASGAFLDLGGFDQTVASLAGAAGSNVTLGSGTLTLGNGTASSFAGVISGSGGIVKQGSGSLVLENANTYSGATTIADGILALAGAGSIANSSSVNLTSANSRFEIQGTTGATIQTLAGVAGSQVELVEERLTVANGSTTFAGVINGSGGGLTLAAGTLILTGTSIFGGDTIVGGTLQVDGALLSSATTVNSGGTLAGGGIVNNVHVASGGTLAPGASAGTLTTGNVSISGGTLAIELGGTNVALYDRVNVTGTVSLANATLAGSLINGFNPEAAGGATFTVIDNDGTDAVTGTFNGLAEGASFSFGGSLFTISYVGGTGNDVVLTVAVNDGPVNTLPGAQTVEANNDLAIAGLAVSDPDAGTGTISTTLSVAHGTLTVAPVSGASVSGSGTFSVMITGTLAQINATLAAAGDILYTPAHDFFGADTLTMVTNDNGHTGAGDPLSDTDMVTINVNTLLTGTQGNDDFDGLPGNVRIDALGGLDTITFDFALVDATVSYAGNTVVIDGPSSHTVLTGFETFVFTDGTVENDDGNLLIDDLFYSSQYHDVWNAHADADSHYDAVGWQQGRDPSAFFDTSLYLAAYPDVAAAGANPLSHFDTIGWKELRVPALDFGAREYLAANPDVAAANVDPLWHFLAVGASEGRQPIAPDRLIGSNGFDYVYYLNAYADVKAAGVDPLRHFQTVGWMEGRNPNALFDTAGYLATYTDVAAAHINPLDHYNSAGWHEGRDPSVGFDTTSYLAAYADVAAANINPLTHFLAFGQQEGRSAFADNIWG